MKESPLSNNLIKIHNVHVSKDCLKKLKHISVDKEFSLPEVVQEILERFVAKKTFDVGTEN